jgi:DNA-directed RNA polymerase
MLNKHDLKEVKQAVNIVQETGWKINRDVFEVMDTLFSSKASSKALKGFFTNISSNGVSFKPPRYPVCL